MESEASLVNPTSDRGQDTRPQEAPLDENSTAAKEVLPDGWELLPWDRNYNSPGYRLYRYRGITADSLLLTWGLMQQLEEFRGRSSDVIVVGFPRSGTTWLQEIVLCVTQHKEMTDRKGSGVPLEFSFPLLEVKSQKGVMEMATLEDIPGPRFIKTHLPYHMLPESMLTSGAKMLYISRDARDVCVSFYHCSRMMNVFQYRGTFSEYRDSFTQDGVVYTPYREHVKGYLDHSDTVLCLTYGEMHQDRASVVRKVADFLGVALTDVDINNIVRNTSFDVMKVNPDTNFHQWEENGMIPRTDEFTFMRKGVVGDWKNYFTEEENRAFMKWRNEEV